MNQNKFNRIQNSNKLKAEKYTQEFKKFGYGNVLSLNLEENDTVTSTLIGSVNFKSETYGDGVALPFDKNFITLPTKNEEIELYRKIINGVEFGPIYYRRIGTSPFVNFSNASNEIDSIYGDETPNNSRSAGTYTEVKATNTPSTNNSNKANTIGYGDYFQPQLNIHKLKLYEGDTLIESRFGQSIRFSAYKNGTGKDRKFAPTLIIRN